MSMFAVVEFVDTSEIDIVPLSWIEEKDDYLYTKWPPLRGVAVVNAVKSLCQPQPHWQSYKIRQLGTSGKSNKTC